MDWVKHSDIAIAKAIGEFIRHHRLEQNKTQELLATEAGVNRSTLIAIEAGKPRGLLIVIQLLRALNQLHVLQSFEITEQISPLYLAEMEAKKNANGPVNKAIQTRLNQAGSDHNSIYSHMECSRRCGLLEPTNRNRII